MAKGGYRYSAGRRREHERAEDFRSIDVRRFGQEGMLQPGNWNWWWRDPESRQVLASIAVVGCHDALLLRYRMGDRDFDTHVSLERTACGFGGSRAWFRCPRCSERVAILYVAASGFACRHCHGLVYAIQSAGEISAAWQRSRKAGDRLGPNWIRPKGMHDRTYARLQEKAYRSMLTASSLVSASTARLEASVERLGLAETC